MNAPTVDVVIATHQRPELLRECLAAVLAQRYGGEIRCTVVFDRSTPDTSLASVRGDRSVAVIANHRTPGLAGARNSGILHGGAPYVAFCDDDDVWHPDKLRRQIAILEHAEQPTCVSGIAIDYKGILTERVPTEADVTAERLLRRRSMPAHPSSVVVRRDALTGPIGLVDEEIPGSYGEDFDWILRAAHAGGVAVAQEPLVTVRWGSSQFSTQWRTIVEAIDYGLTKHPGFRADRRALGRLYGRRAFALAALRDPASLRAAFRAARTWPLEPRAYLALAVTLHIVSAQRLLHLAHRRGHGI